MECIVNVTPDWGIGRHGELLVAISADLRRFRQLTQGKTVILGRKTLATFPGGRPLKNRRNLILSHDPAFQVEGAEVVHSLPELLQAIQKVPEEQLCVIGGAAVYEMLLPYCTTAQVTKSYVTLKADTFFPDLDADSCWSLAEEGKIEEENGVRFQYLKYVHRSPRQWR